MEWKHQISARVLNRTSCNTGGVLLVRPIHVNPEVTQGNNRIWGEKKGNEPDEESTAGGILSGKV